MGIRSDLEYSKTGCKYDTAVRLNFWKNGRKLIASNVLDIGGKRNG
jgi:hypothetical protein